MTNHTPPLSPAAQAVLDAVHEVVPDTSTAEVLAIAAALRAAARQAVGDRCRNESEKRIEARELSAFGLLPRNP